MLLKALEHECKAVDELKKAQQEFCEALLGFRLFLFRLLLFLHKHANFFRPLVAQSKFEDDKKLKLANVIKEASKVDSLFLSPSSFGGPILATWSGFSDTLV